MKFEKVSYEAFKHDMNVYGFYGEQMIRKAYDNIKIPERKTKYSAGYDIATCMPFILTPGESIVIPTGLKAVFTEDEKKSFHLSLHVRSSVGINRGVVLSNGTAIIDSDYANSPENEGDILMSLYNRSDVVASFGEGERIMQGIFEIHGLTVDDYVETRRTGGVGSTND